MPEPQYHLAELEIALDPTRPEHILPVLSSSRVGVVDVGCGIGQLFVAKGDEVPPGVPRYGFDVDPTVIAYAKGRWPERAEFGVAPAEQLPLPGGSVDFYVSRVTIPLTNIPEALQEAARVLVPGGRLWITLHPISMIFGQIGRAVRRGRVKELIMRSIVLMNGLAFHIFGTGRRILGIRDSWQSRTRMRRELDKGFKDVRVTTNGRHFLIEATRR
ncbi:MAG TPA: class I SAM-dependent methyltransferase [Gemmatimonadaceae bacterium]